MYSQFYVFQTGDTETPSTQAGVHKLFKQVNKNFKSDYSFGHPLKIKNT